MGEVNGGQLVVDALKREGVECIFSLSGGHINPIYEACNHSGIKVVDTRHEQAAAHMAEAWGRLTRTPGVCVVTAGPGFTDAITGIANACMSNSPMVIIAGRSGVSEIETLGLQELEQIEIVRPLVKWAQVVYETKRIDEFVAMAFRHALTGRPGPVFLEIPVDIINRKVDEAKVVRPAGYRPEYKPAGSPEGLAAVIEMLAEAKKPVIIAGSGAHYADAGTELKAFSELTGVPIFTNTMGRGLLPENDPCHMGKALGGMASLGSSDLFLVLGARFGLMLYYGKPPLISVEAKVVQVDILGEEIGRNRQVDLGIVGDVKEVLKGLIELAGPKSWSHFEWRDSLRKEIKEVEKATLESMPRNPDLIHPLDLMQEIDDFLDPDAIVAADGGDTQVWTMMARQVNAPGHFLDSGLFGCLGVGIPFGLAAKLRYPKKQVLVTMGDGSAGLNIMEFNTAIRFDLPIVMVVCNDRSWGMIRHGQKMTFKDGALVGCELGDVAYDKVVESLGGYGETVVKKEDIRPALERAFQAKKPACINVYVDMEPISPGSIMLAGLGVS
ncbi:MAG: thiamine pyrophosphate-binding protein [Proteobacteria bacterium]|nr:thiamine pyrophosphate-binding protein [Pseudomonadota bacterium]